MFSVNLGLIPRSFRATKPAQSGINLTGQIQSESNSWSVVRLRGYIPNQSLVFYVSAPAESE